MCHSVMRLRQREKTCVVLNFHLSKLMSPEDTPSEENTVKQLCVSMMMKAITDSLCINFYLITYNATEVRKHFFKWDQPNGNTTSYRTEKNTKSTVTIRTAKTEKYSKNYLLHYTTLLLQLYLHILKIRALGLSVNVKLPEMYVNAKVPLNINI